MNCVNQSNVLNIKYAKKCGNIRQFGIIFEKYYFYKLQYFGNLIVYRFLKRRAPTNGEGLSSKILKILEKMGSRSS